MYQSQLWLRPQTGCPHIYKYIQICLYICTFMCIAVYLWISACAEISVPTIVYVYIHMYTHKYTYTCVYICIFTHTHAHTHTHMHIYMHTRTHTQTHTHTRANAEHICWICRMRMHSMLVYVCMRLFLYLCMHFERRCAHCFQSVRVCFGLCVCLLQVYSVTMGCLLWGGSIPCEVCFGKEAWQLSDLIWKTYIYMMSCRVSFGTET